MDESSSKNVGKISIFVHEWKVIDSRQAKAVKF